MNNSFLNCLHEIAETIHYMSLPVEPDSAASISSQKIKIAKLKTLLHRLSFTVLVLVPSLALKHLQAVHIYNLRSLERDRSHLDL